MARTPSKEAHEKVLSAAVQLIAERGVENTSMDAIAAVSGVSKATVYKHWSGKDALLLDVVLRHAEAYPQADTNDVKADLTTFVRRLTQAQKSAQLVLIWPKIIAYSIGHPDFGREMHQRVFGPRRERITNLLERGMKSGELKRGINLEFAIAMLIGPILHFRITDHMSMPPDLPERIVDHFWKVYETASPLTRESPPRSSSRSRTSSRN